MALGLNLISPIASGSSSTSADQSDKSYGENSETTLASANSTGAEPATGASQTNEAKPSQTVQPVSTDIAATSAEKSGIVRSAEAIELNETAARQFAIKARAESIVSALIDAVSAPIEPSELAAVDAAEAELNRGEAQKIAIQQQIDSLESGLSTIRADN